MSLPGIGVLSYNGFQFGAMTETTNVMVRPQYDKSNRTVKYNQYSFRFVTKIHDQNGTSAVSRLARQALTKPAGPFVYVGRGFCDLQVNVGTVRDVNYGPHPQEISYTPGGADRGHTLIWSIEVCVPDCPDAVYEFSPLEYVYDVAYGRLADGRVTRAISGSLTLPATRRRPGDRQVYVYADDYREKVVAALPKGYTRTFGPFKVNHAKTELTFQYTDTQMGNSVPPEGCIAANMSYTQRNSVKGLKGPWTATLNATYRFGVDAGDPEYVRALASFFATVKDKIDTVRETNKSDGSGKGGRGGSFLPISMEITEPDIYGDKALQVVFSWVYMSTVRNVLAGSGIWAKAKPLLAWEQWAKSLSKSYLSPHGNQKLGLSLGDDKLIDLCRPSELTTPKTKTPANTSLSSGRILNVSNQFLKSVFPAPEEGDSYLNYESTLEAEFLSGTVVSQTIPEEPVTKTSELAGSNSDLLGKARDALKPEEFIYSGTATPVPQGPTPAGSPPPQIFQGQVVSVKNLSDDPQVQRRVKPMIVLYITGTAARVGYEVEVPRLISVDGIAAVPACRADRNEGVISEIRFGANDVAISVKRWRLRYILQGTPEDLPVPPNPIAGDL
jgi:hypothetical protein